jgi:HPt (histidine-containing phosphotransfer) domain-containing protein
MNASSNLDPAALERLQRLGGEVFVRKMLALFRTFTQTKIDEAKAAQAGGSFEGVERAAHPIKSSAGNVGAVRVQELAARLEALAHRGASEAGPGDDSGESVADLLGQLEGAFTDVKAELDRRDASGQGVSSASAPVPDKPSSIRE